MHELTRTHLQSQNIEVSISEINDGIYRISGLVDAYGITMAILD